jgi:hypothetical protein
MNENIINGLVMSHTRIVDNISTEELTSVESTQLREISMHARSDMLERIARIKQNIAKTTTTPSCVLGFTVCSACGLPLLSIKNKNGVALANPGTILANDLTKILQDASKASVSSGVFCDNAGCKFYRKSIPIDKVGELTNVAFVQQVTLASDNWLKEHPEYKGKIEHVDLGGKIGLNPEYSGGEKLSDFEYRTKKPAFVIKKRKVGMGTKIIRWIKNRSVYP